MAAVCAERGYAAASVEEVIDRADVEPGAFERYFADKADCALAAVSEVLAETNREAASAFSPESSDWEKLVRAVRALLELLAARPSAARLACIEARQSMPPGAYDLYASGIRLLAAMLDRVRAYAAVGAPASATRGAIGGAELLIRRELIAGRAEHLPELLPDIIYGTVVPFLDQQEALQYAELARETVNESR